MPDPIEGATNWQPPGSIPDHRRCLHCHGGLATSEDDSTACQACRWWFERFGRRGAA